ncbi:hypothetical protein BHE74_00033858 [Ensete ventricosum]|nr:hypothetical protein BHE74_00033858 [Ensete ventricosum]RZS25836.1 hypothetical protein BHM03_00059095 [Ensete ventricosum]
MGASLCVRGEQNLKGGRRQIIGDRTWEAREKQCRLGGVRTWGGPTRVASVSGHRWSEKTATARPPSYHSVSQVRKVIHPPWYLPWSTLAISSDSDSCYFVFASVDHSLASKVGSVSFLTVAFVVCGRRYRSNVARSHGPRTQMFRREAKAEGQNVTQSKWFTDKRLDARFK